jgi:signal transduction histidine kinase
VGNVVGGSGASPAPGAQVEYRWLLPSVLLGEGGPDAGNGRVRRTVRDWVVDTCCFLFAAGFALVTAEPVVNDPNVSEQVLVADQIAGALACAAVWLRRRWPVGLALALIPFSAFSYFVSGAVLVALFTVAVHRPFRTVALVGGLSLAMAPIYAALRPDPDPEVGFVTSILLGAVVCLGVIGWGMFVRARRQLVLSLRERARHAEAEAALRAEQAQRLARERIAREMHDVLAHRLSLLSVHAGALEYRPEAPPAEVARAAGVIRSSAHQALQDLREVIGVLRAPAGDPADPEAEAGRPQPTLASLPRLVEESRQAGMRVSLRNGIDDPEAAPAAAGRTAYRIAQEGLTNSRKHAPGAEATVTVAGAPREGLTIEVRNPLPAAEPSSIPGAGQGLIGLTERAALAGGRLEHGPTDSGDFRLYAWLPWPA